MKRTNNRIITTALAFCTCFAMVGCGNDKTINSNIENDFDEVIGNISDDELESNIEDAINNMTDDELEDYIEQGAAELDNETEANEEEISHETHNETYEPLQEILDAELSMGLVQIGDDIFQVGGYLTVNEFIEQYGDKYDLSELYVDGYTDSNSSDTAILRKKDSNIIIKLHYRNYTSEMINTGDAVVTYVYPYEDDSFTQNNTWYAGGYKAGVIDMSYEELMQMFTDLGLSEGKIPPNNYYETPYSNKTQKKYLMYLSNDKNNLNGEIPFTGYHFGFTVKTGEVLFYGMY